MIKTILSIAGKPGLYRLVNRGRNNLIVESLSTGKRMPAFSTDKISSLADIAIYTTDEDKPLGEVLELVKEKAGGQPVDVKALGDDSAVREYFGTVLPEFDHDRVYTSDIRKLLSWYNALLAADITEFVEPKADETSETAAE
ncbi:MAG: DUF5606 domain-containing protein [Bacteroidales bacterium]|nr:DUF5606 domain-containing protein [Bacteroidales bacterium]